ncbi:MAG: hypothetical protein KBD27_02840 [Candidatus Moranbacteria bacterium]|nr:hypothetical protein [Candidatus Moranbacteria bacterium]
MKLHHLVKINTLPTLFGLSFVVFGWFVLSLALAGLFFFPLIAFGSTLLFALVVILSWKIWHFTTADLRIASILILVATLLMGVFIEPTIFSGRDQGSIAEAAYRLATNTELAFSSPLSESFFEIYGPGTALNFPGFAYTEQGYLITQFPLGYTAWLGGFVSLFGLNGFAIGNALLFFLSLFFFYQLLRLFVHPYYALAGLVLAITSFLPTWFAKVTLTENLALFLFLFLVYNLLLFFREGKFLFYMGILLSGGLLAFTRIEGFAFLLLALMTIAFHPHTRSLFRNYPWKSIIIPGVLFTFFFMRDFFINLPYYKMIGKALFKFLRGFSDTALAGVGTANSFGLGSIFFLYGFLTLALVGFFGILLFLKKKQWLMLLPTFIALPTFLYLFSPNITPDHPWMLRRYLFSIFPSLLFSAVVCIAYLFSHEQKAMLQEPPRGKKLLLVSLLFLGLILLQIPAWNKQFAFAENRGLREQIATWTAQFSANDLVLVDQNATGDGFAMLTGPGQFLFGKNTVYFFNPYDLPALDTSRFERVFLLVPEESQGRYGAVFGERLIYKQSVTFSLEQFENLSLSQNPAWRLPEKTTTKTTNLLFQVY